MFIAKLYKRQSTILNIEHVWNQTWTHQNKYESQMKPWTNQIETIW